VTPHLQITNSLGFQSTEPHNHINVADHVGDDSGAFRCKKHECFSNPPENMYRYENRATLSMTET